MHLYDYAHNYILALWCSSVPYFSLCVFFSCIFTSVCSTCRANDSVHAAHTASERRAVVMLITSSATQRARRSPPSLADPVAAAAQTLFSDQSIGRRWVTPNDDRLNSSVVRLTRLPKSMGDCRRRCVVHCIFWMCSHTLHHKMCRCSKNDLCSCRIKFLRLKLLVLCQQKKHDF